MEEKLQSTLQALRAFKDAFEKAARKDIDSLWTILSGSYAKKWERYIQDSSDIFGAEVGNILRTLG